MKFSELTKCTCGKWDQTKRFSNRAEYNNFVVQVSALISVGSFIKMAPKQEVKNQKYYRCLKCGQIWKLVAPDPPYRGYVQQVSQQ